MSDKKDKKDKGSKTEKVTTPAATFVAPAVGPVPMTLLQRTVETEIITKWNTRPFARFPIHKDVPRFIRTIKVVTDKGEELYKADAAEPQNVAVRRLISAFSTAFEPSNAERLMEPLLNLPEKVDTESMSIALHQMDDIENVSSPTMKLLKGLNQGILAPAVVNLQLSFMNTRFMFTDVSWNIEVRIFDEHVRISHCRVENFLAGVGFFAWDCTLILRRTDMSLLNAKVRILAQNIGDEGAAQEWTKLVQPIFEPALLGSCSAIFNKEWNRLPIAKDLIRFATHTTFVLGPESSSVRADSESSTDPISHLKQLLLKLSEIVSEDDMRTKIESTFDSGIGKLRGGDLNAVLRSYLSDTLEWSDDSAVPRLCKFFTQSIIAPLATNLQIGLSGISPVKDGNTWRINVSLVPSGFTIRHTKDQMSLDRTDPSKCFDITWQTEFEIDDQVKKICSVQARVVSVTFPLENQLSPAEVEQKRKELTSLVNVLLL